MDIKCWNYDRSPAFDIANFDSFYTECYKKPDKLLGKYLIVGYIPNKHGFKIKYVGLKSLWDLMGPGQKYPIKLQVKKNIPYAVRPINIIKKPEEAFGDLTTLLQAVKETRRLFPQRDLVNYTPDEWYQTVIKKMKESPLFEAEKIEL